MEFTTHKTMFNSYLTLNGAGAVKQVTADYSVTPVKFYITPEYGVTPNTKKNINLSKMVINFSVAGALTASGYGDNTSPLTNGISMTIEDSSGNILADLLDGETIKTNSDWAIFADKDDAIDPAASNSHFTASGSFIYTYGAKEGIKLHGEYGDRFVLTFNDDFSGSFPMLTQSFLFTGTISASRT